MLNGAVSPYSSVIGGIGLTNAIAGKESSFTLQTKDSHRSEVQVIEIIGESTEFQHDVQSIEVQGNTGNNFTLQFRGEETNSISIGISSLVDLEAELEQLPTIGDILITSTGSHILSLGDIVDVTFLSEFGDLPILSSDINVKVSKKIVGQTSYRKEVQSIFCDSLNGSALISNGNKEVELVFDFTMLQVSEALTALAGSMVRVVDDDMGANSVCDPSGRVTHIIFDDIVNNISPFHVVSFSGSSGSFQIFGDGEDTYGAVNGINPVMGYFSLTFEGESTSFIPVYASAGEVELTMRSLSTIGSVSVTKDIVELAYFSENEGFAQEGITAYGIWTITFAAKECLGYAPLDNYPMNIGDVEFLKLDTTQIVTLVSTQHISKNPIQIHEVIKGTIGNNRTDDSSDLVIEFNAHHSLFPEVGIGSHESQTIQCSYNSNSLLMGEPNGTFYLQLLSEKIIIGAMTSLESFQEIIKESFSGLRVNVTGSYSSICHFDRFNPVTATTKIEFIDEGPLPNFEVVNIDGLHINTIGITEGYNSINYVGKGKYEVTYTPKKSGHYNLSVLLEGKHLPADLSTGLLVVPSKAYAISSEYSAEPVVSEGVEATILIQARDKFGNVLDSSLPHNERFIVNLEGHPHRCSGILTYQSVPVSNFDKGQGVHEILYNPGIAGVYLLSIKLRQSGGLLGTYYSDAAFQVPVYGNNDHFRAPYHDVPWCPDEAICDSTKLDNTIDFQWGFGSPEFQSNRFPIDYFSISWEGELMVPNSDKYEFSIRLNGGVKLSIDSTVIIDELNTSSSHVAGSIQLDQGILYPIKLWYIHYTDEAYIHLFWAQNKLSPTPIPSTYLFYSRHIGQLHDMSPNPFEIVSYPGQVDTLSHGYGDGLTFCVANEKCSFFIQTKDSFGNNRYNNGTSPEFNISITGK